MDYVTLKKSNIGDDMKRIFFTILIATIVFGQSWNTWQTWNDWLGNRLGPNLVTNGYFYDYTFDYTYIGNTTQVLNETSFDTFNKWTVSNDISWNSSDSTVKYLFSANHTSQLIQISTNRAYSGDASQLYGFSYTIDSVATAPDGDFSLTFKWGTSSVSMPFTQGKHYVELISPSGASTADIIIEANCTTSTVGEFYLDDFDIHRVGMLAHWVFDDYFHTQEGTGKTILQDLTGNGYDLSASTGFDYTHQLTGDNPNYKNGNALRFDGVDDRLVRSEINPNQYNFSLGFVVRHNAVGAISESQSYLNNGWRVIVNSSGYLKVYAMTDTGSVVTVGQYTDYQLNTFNIIFVTFSGDSMSADIKCYVNGTEAFTNTVAGFAPPEADRTFTLGYNGGVPFLNGYMSEAAYFNRTLNATEVEALSKKPRHWTWNESGTLDRSGWSPVLSGGAELTQDVTGLDANRSYKERIQKDGVTTSTTVTGVTSKTYTLTDGTYGYVKLQRK